MHYDPILCMNVPDSVRTTDFAGFVLKKQNGYELGVNSNHTLYLAFPGETMNNPHMYLGKDDPANRKRAEEMFNKFKNIKNNDSKACDGDKRFYVDYRYKGRSAWFTVRVMANSKEDAIDKAKRELERQGKKLSLIEKFNVEKAIDNDIKSCDMDIFTNDAYNNRTTDADYFTEHVKDFNNLANKIIREFKNPENAENELYRVASAKINSINDMLNIMSSSASKARNSIQQSLRDYSQELFKKYMNSK